jgi:hypothetical protein
MAERIQPGRWRYWMAGALMVLGALAFAVFFLSLSSATDDMVQVIVPGEVTLEVEEPGDFVIFYESRSVVDGRTFATGELPGLTIQIVSDATGEPVEITEPSTNVSYSVGGRSGESVAAFSVDEPGDYTMRGVYPEGQSGDEVVLAVGSGSTGAVGAALLIAGFGMVLLIAGIILAVRTYVRRRRARRQAEDAVPGPAPAPTYT